MLSAVFGQDDEGDAVHVVPEFKSFCPQITPIDTDEEFTFLLPEIRLRKEATP